jgi:glycerol-3-phosphate O-acyltransferase
VEAREYGAAGDAVYVVRPDRRLRLDFHRNGLAPLFVGEAIVATAVLAAEAPGGGGAPRDDARELSRLLRHEFVFPVDRTFDDLYDAAATSLTDAGLLDAGGRAAPGAGQALRFFRATLQPLLEAYLAVASCGARGGDKALVEAADRLYQRGDIDLPEARSGVTLRNARSALGSSSPDALRADAAFLRRLLA